jgi:hypothetical protein
MMMIIILTPWCRILFEKLIVTQLFKKYPAFLRIPKVHHRVHKSSPLDPILNQPNPVRPSIPISLRFILMLSSHLRLGLNNNNNNDDDDDNNNNKLSSETFYMSLIV